MTENRKKGFTLVELLIVIGIIGVLAAIILVAVDPAKRLAQARDARRYAEVNGLLNAILNYTVDNKGVLPSKISSGTATWAQVLGTCGTGTNPSCSKAGANVGNFCIDLGSDLVDGYIASIPTDPSTGTAAVANYYVTRSASGRIEVGSCNPEQTTTISVKR